MENNHKKIVTVFTPTYNRAYTLSTLYRSLCSQSSNDFEWLIVDDGSTDSTKDLVSSFLKEKILDIQYVYQDNGGKQRAINRGVCLAHGELFFIVDSDDYLTQDAVLSIITLFGKMSDVQSFAGFCFRRIDVKTGRILGSPFPDFKFDATSLELAYTLSFNMDKAEVFFTSVLRRFPFPEIEGEKFVPEALVWFRIANQGLKLRCINQGIYCCEYLPDGYTKNFLINLKQNRKGFCLFYKELCKYKEPSFFPYKIKAFIRMFQCICFKFIR